MRELLLENKAKYEVMVYENGIWKTRAYAVDWEEAEEWRYECKLDGYNDDEIQIIYL